MHTALLKKKTKKKTQPILQNCFSVETLHTPTPFHFPPSGYEQVLSSLVKDFFYDKSQSSVYQKEILTDSYQWDGVL